MKNFDLSEVIKQAVEEADHPFCDEQDFRVAVVQKIKEKLKNKKPLIVLEHKYKNESNRTSMSDIYISFDNKDFLIELKYRPNCTKNNKAIRDGNIKLKGKNKGITITWEIDKLSNHANEISVPHHKNDYGAIITWNNGKHTKRYCIMTQNLAYECIDDINKLQYYVDKIDKKTIGYAVVLGDHDWPEVHNHIDLENGAQTNNKQSRKHHILVNKGVSVKQQKLVIDKNTPHQGYWLEIAKIKHN